MERQATAVKTCVTCQAEKSLDEFYRDKNRSDGLYPHCKACHYERTSTWRSLNIERVRELERERYHAGGKHRKKAEKRLRKYGLTPEQYDALLARQRFMCPICELPFAEDGPSGDWDIASVDHDHATGQVRGILHRRCNLALELGLTAEDWKRADAYLARHEGTVDV